MAESTERQDEGLGAVYEAEAARLWRAVFAFSRDRAVTDDAVSEAFAQCLGRGDAIRDPRAWVWRAAFRLAAGELRNRGRTVRLQELPVTQPLTEDPSRLLAALASLPTNQRAVVLLHGYAGYGTDEIAEILGIARATVRVHLSRGRKKLRHLMEEW